MKGYVAQKGDRWYAVIYEGLDPVTGKEKRSWHPAGTSQEEAEQLAARLAAELNGRNDEVRSLTNGRASADRIKAAAVSAGMVPLRDSGLALVRAGVTTAAEVARVINPHESEHTSDGGAA